jgi:ferrochelatase
MARNGVKHAVCFTTSVFDSGSSNKRYSNALEIARQKTGSAAPVFETLSLPFDHPLFIEAQTDRLLEVLAQKTTNSVRILFSAHSIPKSDTACSNYVTQLRRTCQSIIKKIEKDDMPSLSWELVFQSQSGEIKNWLEPDIKERIREIAATGHYQSLAVLPLGFFCENMETVNDLDWEIGELCSQSGLQFFRAKTVGALPKICKMIVEEIIKTA